MWPRDTYNLPGDSLKLIHLTSAFVLAGSLPASTISYSGSPSQYTVPTTGIYQIVAFGASGGAVFFAAGGGGGDGAEIGGELLLFRGDILDLYIGGIGGSGNLDGGGGGGTFVRTSTGTLLLAAGGGGGASSNQPTVFAGGDAQTGTSGGGDAGGTNGSGGTSPCLGGGGGGYLGSGGGDGVSCAGGGQAFPSLTGGKGLGGKLGDSGNGGYGGGGGGDATQLFVGSPYLGFGGGGGGYSGGGGGDLDVGPGGGGGSYLDPVVTDRILSSTGDFAHDGFVTITLVQATPEPASLVCLGLGLIAMAALARIRRA